MEPFFSKTGIARMEPRLQELVVTLVQRLQDYKGTGKVLRLDHVFTALAGDIVNVVCVEKPSMTFLRHEEFNPYWYACARYRRAPEAKPSLADNLPHRFNVFHNLLVSMPILTNFPSLIK